MSDAFRFLGGSGLPRGLVGGTKVAGSSGAVRKLPLPGQTWASSEVARLLPQQVAEAAQLPVPIPRGVLLCKDSEAHAWGQALTSGAHFCLTCSLYCSPGCTPPPSLMLQADNNMNSGEFREQTPFPFFWGMPASAFLGDFPRAGAN